MKKRKLPANVWTFGNLAVTLRWHWMIIRNFYLFFVIYISTGISSSTQAFKHYQTGAASLS